MFGPHADEEVSVTVRHAGTVAGLENMKESKRRGPAPRGPGQPLAGSHALGIPFRPSRPLTVVGSPVAIVPETDCGAPPPHVGKLNVNVVGPPVFMTVSLKSIGVPHVKFGEVSIL